VSQPFKRNYLQHALAVTHWMRRHGASGGIDPLSHVLEIRCNGRERRFQPQFVIERSAGGIAFTPQLQPNVSGFVSWLPYFNKTWPIAQDKIEFKAYAAKQRLRTPPWTTDVNEMRGAYLIKARRSTLGRGQRGPYETPHREPLREGEYCEQLVFGRLLKAWFWDGDLAVVEVVDMPSVTGDGRRALRSLIDEKFDRQPLPHAGELAGLQGLGLDDVPVDGRRVVVEYRYMSPLNPSISHDHDVRSRIVGTPLEAQLLQAGRACWHAVPEDRRSGTAFTLDGVADRDGRAWFLEANCNPLLHPAFYESMLDGIFLR